ncbi:MAG: hypothetical protein ABI835_17545, partial [Chloroflexota bacterium]
VKEAVQPIFGVLEEIENDGARMELALALARILSAEHHFIRLLRGLRQDKGTMAAQVLAAWKRKAGKDFDDELQTLIDECANHFASGHMDEGAVLLSQIVRRLPEKPQESVGAQIFAACADKLAESGAERFEYLLLALYTLEMRG